MGEGGMGGGGGLRSESAKEPSNATLSISNCEDFGFRSTLRPSCLRRGPGGGRDPRRWEREWE